MGTSNKKFTIAIWLLCFIAVSLGGVFLYIILSRNAEANILAGEAQESITKNEQLSSVRIALRESSGILQQIDSAFIREDSVPTFIDSLESLADSQGLSLSIGSISVDAIPNAPSTKQLRLRASSMGSWSDIISFIATLESLPQAVLVQKFSLSKDIGAKDGSTRWNATLDISASVLSH